MKEHAQAHLRVQRLVPLAITHAKAVVIRHVLVLRPAHQLVQDVRGTVIILVGIIVQRVARMIAHMVA